MNSNDRDLTQDHPKVKDFNPNRRRRLSDQGVLTRTSLLLLRNLSETQRIRVRGFKGFLNIDDALGVLRDTGRVEFRTKATLRDAQEMPNLRCDLSPSHEACRTIWPRKKELHCQGCVRVRSWNQISGICCDTAVIRRDTYVFYSSFMSFVTPLPRRKPLSI